MPSVLSAVRSPQYHFDNFIRIDSDTTVHEQDGLLNDAESVLGGGIHQV